MPGCTVLEFAIALAVAAAPQQAEHESRAAGQPASHSMSMGSSWQADSVLHAMGHAMRGDWILMGHTQLNAVYDDQQGPRGDDLGFVAGMVMGSARRDSANGVTTLTDRQHPHDLFMELSATYAWRIGDQTSAFLYAALPGEPAFGPPAFMHRSSTMMSPEAPITQQFTGREPDEDRYDIERPRFDSTALRTSWNPGDRWSLQLSWADVESPEQLEPEVDDPRLGPQEPEPRRIDGCHRIRGGLRARARLDAVRPRGMGRDA